MSGWLIYVRHCPVCGQGLARVRTHACGQDQRFCLVCDKCDSTWQTPTSNIYTQVDPSHATFPETAISVWSGDSRWAGLVETIQAGWYGDVTIVRDNSTRYD